MPELIPAVPGSPWVMCATCDQPVTYDPDSQTWRNRFGYATHGSEKIPLHYHDPESMRPVA